MFSRWLNNTSARLVHLKPGREKPIATQWVAQLSVITIVLLVAVYFTFPAFYRRAYQDEGNSIYDNAYNSQKCGYNSRILIEHNVEYNTNNTSDNTTSVYTKVRAREKMLSRLAQLSPVKACSTTKFVRIGGVYGQDGSRLFQYATIFWLGQVLDRTVILSISEQEEGVLSTFHLVTLKRSFCFVSSNSKSTLKGSTIVVNAKALAQPNELYKLPEVGPLLPPMNKKHTFVGVAEVYVKFFCALYSQVRDIVRTPTLLAITELLGPSLNYAAVHKRHFAGNCGFKL